MKILAGLTAAALLGFGTQSIVSNATASGPGSAPQKLVTSPAVARTAPAETSVNAAIAAQPVVAGSVVEPIAPAAPREWIRDGAPNRVVLVPNDICESGAPFDVLVHFHGVPVSTEPSVHRTNLNAVVVIVNWGIGSGAYENRFQMDGSLCSFLDGVEKTVDHACKKQSGGVKRVALSAWSAGYGAIYRILFHEKDSARVDSVLLADGLHAGYLGYHKVNPLQMEGFSKFADMAAQGQKLFAISHSEVKPMKYASTEETADFLLDHAGVSRTTVSEPGPRPKMTLVSKADKNGFHVRGFSGGGLDDHSNHLHGIGATLWTILRDRWSKP